MQNRQQDGFLAPRLGTNTYRVVAGQGLSPSETLSLGFEADPGPTQTRAQVELKIGIRFLPTRGRGLGPRRRVYLSQWKSEALLWSL
jgi:hypothetical protein